MYVCSAIFNIVQYVLYALSAIYVLVTVVCVRGMHEVMIHCVGLRSSMVKIVNTASQHTVMVVSCRSKKER